MNLDYQNLGIIYLVKLAVNPSITQAAAAIVAARRSSQSELARAASRAVRRAEKYVGMTRARQRRPPGLDTGVGRAQLMEDSRSEAHNLTAEALDELTKAWYGSLKQTAPHARDLARPGRISKPEAARLADHIFSQSQKMPVEDIYI